MLFTKIDIIFQYNNFILRIYGNQCVIYNYLHQNKENLHHLMGNDADCLALRQKG